MDPFSNAPSYSVTMVETSQQLRSQEQFKELIKNPPCPLYMKVDDLLSHKTKKSPTSRYSNSFILYRRNMSAKHRSLDANQNPYFGPLKVVSKLYGKMWHDESAEVKKFYQVLSAEGQRR